MAVTAHTGSVLPSWGSKRPEGTGAESRVSLRCSADGHSSMAPLPQDCSQHKGSIQTGALTSQATATGNWSRACGFNCKHHGISKQMNLQLLDQMSFERIFWMINPEVTWMA